MAERAYREARKVKNGRATEVMAALSLLREVFVPMKRSGGSTMRAAFDDACEQAGFRISKIGDRQVSAAIGSGSV